MRRRACTLSLAALSACGAGGGVGKDAGTAPRPDAATTLEAGSGTDDDGGSLGRARCVPRAPRVYVGLSEGMTLDNFELAAYEAERILALIEHELCARANELEPNGRLAADLAAHRLELFEVLFVRDDASAADVGLRALDDATPNGGTGYRIAVERADDAWRLVVVTLG